jgi:pSer/pThr/pTyr-binding forkhead associated (FHA) protein
MYKDIKGGGRKKVTRSNKNFALEILESGENANLKKGGIIPISGEITIGRRDNNLLVLNDKFVSGNHARIFIKNTDFMLEDLESTNGTKVNDERIEGKVILRVGDEIEIGSVLLKVIG